MFRLSRLTDYAVALLTRMAGDTRMIWAAPDLAEQSGLPLPTVSKILKQLAKKGILIAQRGAAGGYRLSQPASTMTIAAIVEAMDGPIAITDCADGNDHNCRVESLCPMSGNWNKVNQVIRDALNSLSLAEMADSARTMPTATLSRPVTALAMAGSEQP